MNSRKEAIVAGFEHTMAAIPGGSTRRTYGTAYWDGTKWFANVGGSLLDARWLDPIQPIQNGNLVIDLTDDGRGQSTALVVGGYTDQPRPSTGVVLTPGATEIVFTGADAEVYTTDRFIGTYIAGDPVYITWDAAKPTVIGKVAAISVPPALAPPDSAVGATSGQTTLIATASDTFGVGGWGRWATSRNGGEDVYTGTLGAYTLTGAWFYGAPKPELAGKTITRVRFRVPARLPQVGDYNNTVVVHFYAHNSGSRPGGDVSRIVGPHDANITAGWSGDYIDLPLTFAAALQAGGGISIAGNPYTGFASRLDDAQSGKILMDWTA